jgi:hypothetical protein
MPAPVDEQHRLPPRIKRLPNRILQSLGNISHCAFRPLFHIFRIAGPAAAEHAKAGLENRLLP